MFIASLWTLENFPLLARSIKDKILVIKGGDESDGTFIEQQCCQINSRIYNNIADYLTEKLTKPLPPLP